ncbi:MAG: hypothetical protein U0166_27200 [Acidobacteriota bacterium]
MSRPDVAFRCPNEGCDEPVGAVLDPAATQAACGACGTTTSLKAGSVDAAGRVVHCPVCGMEDFWLKKNFRSEYGCLILVVAACFMDLTYQLSGPAAVLLDLVLYQFLGDVAVCYRCKAEIRHAAKNPAHLAYDLHHATDLDKEIYRAGGAKAFIEWASPAPASSPGG